MTLEELIRSWFLRNEGIAGALAKYAGSPAVFLQTAPSDSQPGWGKKNQYPRIVNRVEMRADRERKSQGLLTVELYCDVAEKTPEEIEPLIRASMKDILMQPEDGPPFCFAWAKTEGFELEYKLTPGHTDKRIAGYELTFDILEYPDQYTTYPDPVESLGVWIKTAFPQAFVLGIDKINEFRVATEDEPVVYVRCENVQSDHNTLALAWINCRLAVHVIAPSTDARSKWARIISNAIMIAGTIQMTDGSPLRFTAVSGANSSDYLITGQIMATGQYILPRLDEDTNVLRNVHFQ